MNLDNPDRYDLELHDTDLPPNGFMNRHRQGDYVLASAFDELLEAYNARGKLLEQIAELSCNA